MINFRFIKQVISWFFILVIITILWGCGKNAVNIYTLSPEEQLEYAKKIFEKKNYYKAKTQLTIVVYNNPGNRVIEEAQFYLGECHYHIKEYFQAITEYQKLIRSLPTSPFVDNARYKIGMCYFKLAPSYSLDQEYTYKAISQFQQFLDDYPNSDLKPEVEKKLAACREKLAKKEFTTGELYRKMGYYRAAIISYDAILESHYDSKFADDALFWKGECFRKLSEWSKSEEVFLTFLTKYTQSPLVTKVQEKLKEVREKQKNG